MKRDLAIAAVIFIAALGLRAWVRANIESDYALMWGLDGREYHDAARAYMHGDWPQGKFAEAFFRAPLYPIALGWSLEQFGDDIAVPRWIQAILGSLSCVLVYLLGRLAFAGRRIALAGAAICVGHGTLIYFEGQILSPTLDLFLGLAALCSLVIAKRKHRGWCWSIAGALLGVASLSRAETLAFLPIVVAWLAFDPRFVRRPPERARYDSRAFTKSLACLLIPYALAILPVAYYNAKYDLGADHRLATGATLKKLLSGSSALIATNGGINFYLGNHSAIAERNATDHDEHFETYDRIKALPVEAGIESRAERSRFLSRATWRDIALHPGAALAHAGRKLLEGVNGAEIARNSNLYAHAKQGPLAYLLWVWGGFAFPGALLWPLAAIGWFATRRETGAHMLLGGRVLLMLGIGAAFFVTARYRIPVVPIIALYAAAGALALCDRWRARGSGCLPLVIAFAGSLVVCNLPIVAVAHAPAAYEKRLLALTLKELGRTDDAFLLYRELLAEHATALDHTGIGAILRQRREFAEALKHFEAAYAMDPEDISTLNGLGLTHRDLGHFDRAVEYLEAAIDVDPHDATLLSNLGSVFVALDRYDDAKRAYRRALEIDPRHADTLYNLGAVADYLGDPDEARTHYEQAIAANPEHARSLEKLAALEGKRGNLNLARQYLERTITAYRKTIGSATLPYVVYRKLGQLEEQLGNHEAAARDFERARESYRAMNPRAGH